MKIPYIIWKPCPETNGRYEVSICGQVRNRQTGQILALSHGGRNCKYLRASFYVCRYRNKRGQSRSKYKKCSVHRLVWIAFNGPIPEGLQVDHINRNPAYCALWNLQLLNGQENRDKRVFSSQAKASIAKEDEWLENEEEVF